MADALAGLRLAKLEGVHPRLIEVVKRLGYAMNELGFHVVVTDGVRTVAQQRALYAKGRTAPGPLVTNADGVAKRSNHQPHADGWGHAVDLCFMDEHGAPSWDAACPWRLLGEMAKSQGCVWGGDWASIVDRPHVELPDGVPETGAAFAKADA